MGRSEFDPSLTTPPPAVQRVVRNWNFKNLVFKLTDLRQKVRRLHNAVGRPVLIAWLVSQRVMSFPLPLTLSNAITSPPPWAALLRAVRGVTSTSVRWSDQQSAHVTVLVRVTVYVYLLPTSTHRYTRSTCLYLFGYISGKYSSVLVTNTQFFGIFYLFKSYYKTFVG